MPPPFHLALATRVTPVVLIPTKVPAFIAGANVGDSAAHNIYTRGTVCGFFDVAFLPTCPLVIVVELPLFDVWRFSSFFTGFSLFPFFHGFFQDIS